MKLSLKWLSKHRWKVSVYCNSIIFYNDVCFILQTELFTNIIQMIYFRFLLCYLMLLHRRKYCAVFKSQSRKSNEIISWSDGPSRDEMSWLNVTVFFVKLFAPHYKHTYLKTYFEQYFFFLVLCHSMFLHGGNCCSTVFKRQSPKSSEIVNWSGCPRVYEIFQFIVNIIFC